MPDRRIGAPSGLRSLLTYNAYRWLARFAEVLPRSAIPVVASVSARVGVVMLPQKRRLVSRHLGRVMGRVATSGEVRSAFAEYVRYWLEALRLPSVPFETVARHVDVEGAEHLERARAQGKGALLALAHLGNWDVAGRWLVESGVPLSVVAERLEPPRLHTWFTDFRRSLGFDVLVNGPAITGEIVSALARNDAVALLCDRDVDGSGRSVEFFGEVTALPAGPAVLALRTGATLLPVGIYADGLRYRLVVQPPVDASRRGEFRDDVARVHADLVSVMESLIEKAPTQWHLFGANWPSDKT